MKHIINIVGTSLISNYIEKESNSNEFRYIEDEPVSEYERNKERIAIIKRILKNFTFLYKEKASAELQTISKIEEIFKDKINAHLLCTDTLSSLICGEIINEFLIKEQKIDVNFNKSNSYIESLQVVNKEKFLKEGVPNLIRKLQKITVSYCHDDLIINITGGYKGIIPLITFWSMINEYQLVYMFENSNQLIFEPKIPIKFDYSIIEENLDILDSINKEDDNLKIIKSEKRNLIENLSKKGLIEYVDDHIFISPIGQIMFDEYMKKLLEIFVTKEVKENIENDENLKNFIFSHFKDKNSLELNTEIKNVNEHKVCGKSRQNYRVFYFIDNNDFYIYKTFRNTDAEKKLYEKYINEKKINKQVKEEIKNNSIKKVLKK